MLLNWGYTISVQLWIFTISLPPGCHLLSLTVSNNVKTLKAVNKHGKINDLFSSISGPHNYDFNTWTAIHPQSWQVISIWNFFTYFFLSARRVTWMVCNGKGCLNFSQNVTACKNFTSLSCAAAEVFCSTNLHTHAHMHVRTHKHARQANIYLS